MEKMINKKYGQFLNESSCVFVEVINVKMWFIQIISDRILRRKKVRTMEVAQ